MGVERINSLFFLYEMVEMPDFIVIFASLNNNYNFYNMKTTIIENSEKKALVSFAGELDTAAVKNLNTALEPLLADAGKEITLDFNGLEYISSAGMRVLLALNKSAVEKGGKVIIIGMKEDIKQIFQLTGFDNIFEII